MAHVTSILYKQCLPRFITTQMQNSYTRESLLAEWESLSPSQELSTEVQDLFLSYLNRPRDGNRREQVSKQTVQSVCSGLDAPQRFERRRRSDKAPSGPCRACEPVHDEPIDERKRCFSSAAPAGPVEMRDKSSTPAQEINLGSHQTI